MGANAEALGHARSLSASSAASSSRPCWSRQIAEVDVGARSCRSRRSAPRDAHRVAQRPLAAHPVARHGHARPSVSSACPSTPRAPAARAAATARSLHARASSPGRGARGSRLRRRGRGPARASAARAVGRAPRRGGRPWRRRCRPGPQIAAETLVGERQETTSPAPPAAHRPAPESDRTVVLAGDERGLRRARHDRCQAELASARRRPRRGPRSPARARSAAGLGEGGGLFGLQPGRHVGGERLGHAVRGAPVVRQLGAPRPRRRGWGRRSGPRRAPGAARSAHRGAGRRRRPPPAGRGGRRSRRCRARARGGSRRRAAHRGAPARAGR